MRLFIQRFIHFIRLNSGSKAHKTIDNDTEAYANITRKLCYRKDDRAVRPIYGCPENFLDYAHGYFSQNFSWAFVLIDTMNVRTKFKVRSFTRS